MTPPDSVIAGIITWIARDRADEDLEPLASLLAWNDHSAELCLARNRAGRTLEAVQRLFPA